MYDTTEIDQEYWYGWLIILIWLTKQGKVRPVKVLGILCMIDEGEADWKVVVIDREDPWYVCIDIGIEA